MIGIIGGSALLNTRLFPDARPKTVSTEYGKVDVLISGKICFIQRHGKDTPPHMINHEANIMALKKMGIKEIIAVSSVGSMKKSIKPGDLVIMDDFIQLSDIPTFFDKSIKFTAPQLSEKLRRLLAESARGFDCHSRGTYLQTRGPRYETKAEIQMMKNFADVVGMTIASEATLAIEQEMEYACICSVDNYANGLSSEQISWDKIVAKQKQNVEKVKRILAVALENMK